MKKFHILALSAITAVGTLTVSCQGSAGSITPNASLKSEADTLSYAFGIQVAESGLSQYLQQLGVVQDTAMFRMSQMQRISAEADPAKKAVLEKELTNKIDSLNKANAENMIQFTKGLQESIGSDSKSKAAYYAGIQVGSQVNTVMIENFEKQVLVEPGQKVNKPALLAGLLSALKKEASVVPNATELIQQKAVSSQEKAQKLQEEELKKQYSSQIEAGDKFMAENKTKEGVVALPSGLQYKVVKEGTGAKPTANDKVKVFYKGSLPDGTVFETNEGGEPVAFGVSQVIKGWTEALQLMPAGSKWTLYIPYDLAYGAQQAGNITPFSNLVFDVELVSVEK